MAWHPLRMFWSYGLASVGLLTCSIPAPVVAATPIKIMSDQPCGIGATDEIRVCGAPLDPHDVMRLHDLVACLVSWRRESSRAAMLLYVRTGDASGFRAISASDSSCQSYQSLRVSSLILAGAFAEALLQAPSPAERHPATLQPLAGAPSIDDEPIPCLMRTGQDDVRRLIQTPLYSRREQAALAPVVARLQACVPVDREMRINLATFRSIVAINLLAQAERVGDAEVRPAPASLVVPGVQLPHIAATAITNDAPTVPLAKPSLSFGQEDIPLGDGIVGIARDDRADLPDKLSDEEDLAKEATPRIDPETGETIKVKPQLRVRRDSGNPY